RSVDPRAVFDLSWNGLEVPHQEPGAERDQEGWIGEDHSPGRITDPEGLHHVAKWDEEQRWRDQVGDEDQGPEGRGPAELQAREGVAGEQATEERDPRRHGRDKNGVPGPAGEQ